MKTPAARSPLSEKQFALIAKALADPETNKLLTNQAMQTVGSTPDAFAAFMQKDIAIWKAVAAAANS